MAKLYEDDPEKGSPDVKTPPDNSHQQSVPKCYAQLSKEEMLAAKAKLGPVAVLPNETVDFAVNRRPSSTALIIRSKDGTHTKLTIPGGNHRDSDTISMTSTELDNAANRSIRRMARARKHMRFLMIFAAAAILLLTVAMVSRICYSYMVAQNEQLFEDDTHERSALALEDQSDRESNLLGAVPIAVFPSQLGGDFWYMGTGESQMVAETTTTAKLPETTERPALQEEETPSSNGLSNDETSRSDQVRPLEDLTFGSLWSFAKRVFKHEGQKIGDQLRRVGEDVAHETLKVADTLQRTSKVVAEHVNVGLKKAASAAEVHAVKIGESVARSSEVVASRFRDVISRRNGQSP